MRSNRALGTTRYDNKPRREAPRRRRLGHPLAWLTAGVAITLSVVTLLNL